MKLSQVKSVLKELETIAFQLPNGSFVPSHFHVTEIGKITKHFIDCGGTERKEEVVNFQLWSANDYNHRLHPEKLISIIELSEKTLQIDDLEIEVEYQGKETIGKYGLDFDGRNFLLTSKITACLALDACGIPAEKPKVKLSTLQEESCCTPDGNCC
ncbi:hypothetical protein JL193_13830 [Polaribacter batillariae]|uniref:Uncharacterized protein n=1 Tax=Polaribacter batillariae TaxID=2808900 RepID=A0ABX7SSE3_9FLAO|nr:DUF6428 family protein [Polaribacter batillariae]QTD37177.1 hypothetical protein JL193_13830 [Polaribacter batillariae]